MPEFSLSIQIRWSDLDPNFHLRHSVYYDWGAMCRTAFFQQNGLSDKEFVDHKIGPILFREECHFRKEIKMDDQVKIDLKIIKAKRDYSRWTIQHRITKDENILCAMLTVDGAWINTEIRKLTIPPSIAIDVYNKMPKDENFEFS